MTSIYSAVYEAWRRAPETFWATAAAEIDWFEPWTATFDESLGAYGRWFSGGLTNTC